MLSASTSLEWLRAGLEHLYGGADATETIDAVLTKWQMTLAV